MRVSCWYIEHYAHSRLLGPLSSIMLIEYHAFLQVSCNRVSCHGLLFHLFFFWNISMVKMQESSEEQSQRDVYTNPLASLKLSTNIHLKPRIHLEMDHIFQEAFFGLSTVMNDTIKYLEMKLSILSLVCQSQWRLESGMQQCDNTQPVWWFCTVQVNNLYCKYSRTFSTDY